MEIHVLSTHSGVNISSPKPEKRQANSPLPPPPTTLMDLHLDKQQVRNLDELYAKVHKQKPKGSSDDEKCPEKPTTYRNSVSMNLKSHEDLKYPPEKRQKEHNYETLRKSPRNDTDLGYEKIKSDIFGYASVQDPDALSISEPSYEVLKQPPSELDPNYAELQDRLSVSEFAGYTKIREHLGADVYSAINKHSENVEKSKTSSSDARKSHEVNLDEPNYESMPSESNSYPNYAALKSTSSESDPNYESVKYLDEPPYEHLDNDSSKTDSDVVSYDKFHNKECEDIDTSESSNDKNNSSDSR